MHVRIKPSSRIFPILITCVHICYALKRWCASLSLKRSFSLLVSILFKLRLTNYHTRETIDVLSLRSMRSAWDVGSPQSRPLTTPLLDWHRLSSAMFPGSGGTIRKGQPQLVPVLCSWSLWLCSQAPAGNSCSNSATLNPLGKAGLKLCFMKREQTIVSNTGHSNK